MQKFGWLSPAPCLFRFLTLVSREAVPKRPFRKYLQLRRDRDALAGGALPSLPSSIATKPNRGGNENEVNGATQPLLTALFSCSITL